MFIVQLFQRLKSESPRFFKVLQIALLALGAIAGAVKWLIENEVLELAEPMETKVSRLLTAVLSFLGGAIFTAALPTNKPELMDDKTKENVLQDKTLR